MPPDSGSALSKSSMFHVKHPAPCPSEPHPPQARHLNPASPPTCLSSLGVLVPASRVSPQGASSLLGTEVLPTPSRDDRNPRSEHSGGPTGSLGHPSGGRLRFFPSALQARRASPGRHRARNAAPSLGNPEPGGPPLRHGGPEGPRIARKSSMFHVKQPGRALEDARGRPPVGSSGGAELRRGLGRVRWM